VVYLNIDPLLDGNLETNGIAAVAMQQRDKHVSTIIELLLETAFSSRSLQRSYLENESL
jgi:hypothetical protein